MVGTASLGTPDLVVDPSASFRALFRIPVTLAQATPGIVQSVTFRITVGSYGSLEVFQTAAPTQRLTGTFQIAAPPDGGS